MMRINRPIHNQPIQKSYDKSTVSDTINRVKGSNVIPFKTSAHFVDGVPTNYCYSNDITPNDTPNSNDQIKSTGSADSNTQIGSQDSVDRKALATMLSKLAITFGFVVSLVNAINKSKNTSGPSDATVTETPEKTPSTLDQVLATIEKSDLGSKLVNFAKQDGVQIEITEDMPAGMNGITYFNSDGIKIEVKKADLEQMTETLVHELVHAATPDDGTAIMEEIYASQIGENVSSEVGVNDHPRSLAAIEADIRSQPAYANLAEDNGVLDHLKALGVTV